MSYDECKNGEKPEKAEPIEARKKKCFDMFTFSRTCTNSQRCQKMRNMILQQI